jgi:hypothetical protein
MGDPMNDLDIITERLDTRKTGHVDNVWKSGRVLVVGATDPVAKFYRLLPSSFYCIAEERRSE